MLTKSLLNTYVLKCDYITGNDDNNYDNMSEKTRLQPRTRITSNVPPRVKLFSKGKQQTTPIV